MGLGKKESSESAEKDRDRRDFAGTPSVDKEPGGDLQEKISVKIAGGQIPHLGPAQVKFPHEMARHHARRDLNCKFIAHKEGAKQPDYPSSEHKNHLSQISGHFKVRPKLMSSD
jgi:hypothetical protein